MKTPNHSVSALSQMEDGVRNVARLGQILIGLGSGTAKEVDAGACWDIGRPLIDLGEEVEAHWEEAFRAARGQA